MLSHEPSHKRYSLPLAVLAVASCFVIIIFLFSDTGLKISKEYVFLSLMSNEVPTDSINVSSVLNISRDSSSHAISQPSRKPTENIYQPLTNVVTPTHEPNYHPTPLRKSRKPTENIYQPLSNLVTPTEEPSFKPSRDLEADKIPTQVPVKNLLGPVTNIFTSTHLPTARPSPAPTVTYKPSAHPTIDYWSPLKVLLSPPSCLPSLQPTLLPVSSEEPSALPSQGILDPITNLFTPTDRPISRPTPSPTTLLKPTAHPTVSYVKSLLSLVRNRSSKSDAKDPVNTP